MRNNTIKGICCQLEKTPPNENLKTKKVNPSLMLPSSISTLGCGYFRETSPPEKGPKNPPKPEQPFFFPRLTFSDSMTLTKKKRAGLRLTKN